MLSRLFGRAPNHKVLIIGLDCGEPSLVFDRFRDDLPNLRRLMEAGTHGPLESTIPAITVPAWASMFSARDPGEMGFYGFRNRVDYTYDKLSVATSASVKVPRVWDIAGESGNHRRAVREPRSATWRDVAPTVLQDLGLTPPGWMRHWNRL